MDVWDGPCILQSVIGSGKWLVHVILYAYCSCIRILQCQQQQLKPEKNTIAHELKRTNLYEMCAFLSFLFSFMDFVKNKLVIEIKL